jgi:lipoprotein-releasing system ATP-binding protein
MNNLIQCQSLGKTYHDGTLSVTVFDCINFSISSKEMVGIIGASGAGKSTLLQLMGGLDKPTSGSVFIGDQDVNIISERDRCTLRNRSLGFIYQFHHLLSEFSAIENICMPLWIAGDSEKIAAEKSSVLLEKVGLQNRMHHRVSELSGGERQRIAIARALVNNPACVLADEPTGNLDQKTAQVIFELMLKLNQEIGTSFVIVTHNEHLANRLNRVLRLENGNLA